MSIKKPEERRGRKRERKREREREVETGTGDRVLALGGIISSVNTAWAPRI